ncbi:MAG: Sugar phosphate isomerase/epimerase [Verrucomicrobia bacterium]|nr:MAG: Sugar phosphate isomerase/epimerase [Verrucomicrobiota bacterium]
MNSHPVPFPVSGIADEAADDIAGQISAHLNLGWSRIEVRQINGKQATTLLLSDEEFESAVGTIEAAGLQVNAFASAIGNWSRPITDDFEKDLTDLRLIGRRAQRTGTRFVRTMSWVGADVPLEQWRDEAVRRYKIMASIAEEAGILLLHENCEGWGGLSPANTREFIERVDHPSVGVLFDIGNTVAYGMNAWDYYTGVKDLIRYVHIKDCRRNPEGGKSGEFTLPGEGDACVREILADLISSGYSAGVSIEPHVASIIHLGGSEASPEFRRDSYLKYGRALNALLQEIVNEPTA